MSTSIILMSMKDNKSIEIFKATPCEIEKAKTGKTCKLCCDGGKKKHTTNDWVCGRCHIVRTAYNKSLKGEVAIVYKLF